jgi:hypothetical protein
MAVFKMDLQFELKQSQARSSTAELLRLEDMVSISKDESVKVQSWRRLWTPYKELMQGSLAGTLCSVQSSCASAKLDDIRKSITSYRNGLLTYGSPSKLGSYIQPLTEEEESANCTVDSFDAIRQSAAKCLRDTFEGDSEGLTPELVQMLANELKGQPSLENFEMFIRRAKQTTEQRTPKPKPRGVPSEVPEDDIKVRVLTDAVKSCEVQIKSLNSVVKEFKGLMKQVHDRWAEENSQVKSLRHQLELCGSTNSTSETSELQRKVQAHADQIASLEAALEAKESEAESSRERVKEVEGKNAELIEQLEENLQMFEEWGQTLQRKKEIEQRLAKSDDNVTRLRQERDDYKVMVRNLMQR